MQHLRYARPLGPRDLHLHWIYTHMAACSFISENYSDAIEFARTAIRINPTNGTAHWLLTAALASSGDIEAAKTVWTTEWEVQPYDLPAYVTAMHRSFKQDEDARKFIDALRLAGALFEQSPFNAT